MPLESDEVSTTPESLGKVPVPSFSWSKLASNMGGNPTFSGGGLGIHTIRKLRNFGGKIPGRKVRSAGTKVKNARQQLYRDVLVGEGARNESWDADVRMSGESSSVLILSVSAVDVPNTVSELVLQKGDMVNPAIGRTN